MIYSCTIMYTKGLIVYCFMSHSRIFHLYELDVTITGEGLQNLGLLVYSALRIFEQGRIFVVPHLLWHGTSVFPVSSEGPPLVQSPLTTHKGLWRTYSS
jgi:hypothetical protein